jgi:hypothetical protein
LINNFQDYLLRAAIQAPSDQEPQQDPQKKRQFEHVSGNEADQLGPLLKKVRSGVQKTGSSSSSSPTDTASLSAAVNVAGTRGRESHECTTHYEDPDFSGIKHIIFVDLDNHQKFFNGLTDYLPEEVFVWGFCGGGAKSTLPRK